MRFFRKSEHFETLKKNVRNCEISQKLENFSRENFGLFDGREHFLRLYEKWSQFVVSPRQTLRQNKKF